MAFKINPITGKLDYYEPSGVPAAHAGTHVTGGGDTIANAIAGGNAGLMSGSDKTKLDGIASGAEVNVNADWNAGSGDAQILNKPTIPTLDYKLKVSTDDTTPNWLSSKIDAGDALGSSVSDEGANEVLKLDVKSQMSIDIDINGLKLENDVESPGNNYVYGTTGAGVKGWKADPAGGTHAATHVTGGGDTIANAVAGGNAGLMSGSDKTKLDGIASGAEVNVNADWNSGSGDSQILNKPSTMPPSTHNTAHVTGGSDIIANAIAGGNAGLMSGADKTKLDGIATGATAYTDEMAQDATGAMADSNSLTYTDATPLLAVKRQMSITADASGIKLDGDLASPGNNYVYGTNGSGTKGWKADPAAGAHDLGGASHNSDTLANLNLKVSDADLVAFAGQIGGTAASPDIRGLRETGGPTLLTMGAVADGDYLRRSGSSITGAVPAGGSTGVALAPSSNTTVSAGYGFEIPNRFTIVDTYYLSIADGALVLIV